MDLGEWRSKIAPNTSGAHTDRSMIIASVSSRSIADSLSSTAHEVRAAVRQSGEHHRRGICPERPRGFAGATPVSVSAGGPAGEAIFQRQVFDETTEVPAGGLSVSL